MKKMCILLAAALIFVWQISYFQRESDRRFEGVFGGEIRMMEKPKVALTFDDDVIIGLSQEISCKEAVSMI